MSNWTRFFTSLHIHIYRLTNGWVGSRLGKQSILILNTTGRRSGKQYLTTLSYYRDGNRYLIVASNWGEERHPAWYFNLMHQPHTSIQVGSNTIAVEAQAAQGEERERLWQLVTAQNEQYSNYQKSLNRRIPIVVLTPTDQQ